MSLPLGLDLNNEINLDKSSLKMTVTLADMGTSEMQRMKADAERWLRNNAPASMHAIASSAALVFSYVSISNAKSMILGTCISLVLISLVLILAFRSWKYGLMSIIPNAIPIVLTMGIWACIDGEIGVAATTVGSMTIGIIVDSTIYIISKYIKGIHEKNMNPEEAVQYAISTVGLALFATCLILIIGFGILATSSFKMNMQMGILSALTLIIATIMDFIFTPSLLLAADQKAMKIRTTADMMISET
jgi:predicted RND superfamily exporter protein